MNIPYIVGVFRIIHGWSEGGVVPVNGSGLRLLVVACRDTWTALSRGARSSPMDPKLERAAGIADAVDALRAPVSADAFDMVVLDPTVSDADAQKAIDVASGPGSGASLVLLDRVPPRRLRSGGRIHAHAMEEFALMLGLTEPVAALRPSEGPVTGAAAVRYIANQTD